ncbi:TolC family outer membrane protein [Thaumasiovibrio sp. DFM-14]|uniref:TolC family outer membrane protein n=1 Tax=Thaumasiovibrio sp. DFM-14 TaxID=3384792 RepID=UPI0039A2D858
MIKNKVLPFSLLAVSLSAPAVAKTVSLTELYQHSLDNNPALQAAALGKSAAFEQTNQTKALYRPQVDAGLQVAALRNEWTNMNETDGHGAEASLTLGQNLYNQELNVAHQLNQQAANLQDTVYQVTLTGLTMQVAAAYFETAKAQEALELSKATLAAISEHMRQTERRYELGLIPQNDVQETRAQFDLATAAVIFAGNDVEKALDSLYELTGQEYTAVKPLNYNHFDAAIPAAPTGSSWEEQAQRFNPEMLIQAHLVELSKEQISLAQAGQMPSLGLLAQFRYAFASESRRNSPGEDKGDFMSVDNNATAVLGMAMTLPVYRGGATDSKIEQARLQYEQALQVKEKTARNVTRQVRNAEKDLRALISAEQAYQQAVVSAEVAKQATEQGFEIGTRTTVDVLAATRQEFSAKQDLSEARINFILAALNLKFIGGQLNADDLLAANASLVK